MRIIRNIYAPPSPPALAPAAGSCHDVRCGCGNLLARVVGDAVELKCRRCKHVWRLALEGGGEEAASGAPRWRLLEGGSR